ncbi:hypothetical protein [Kitasatospora cineracea]|uniref:Uncharacterized protein n=1 Tax=Kitasatospora cineracea TaxID=88074 RepID=A0A3N4RKA7_9ACTN|nr:hypothetical protein [Kitasatospora cineracea]RPE33813.1 hypothetical protein EDD38_2115 [Kitasatospora cineracea]
MALAKKGSRRIVVDGVEYRWRVSSKHWCCDHDPRPLGYAVEHAARPGTTLVVDTGRPAVFPPEEVPEQLVLPGEVAAGVRVALADGWTPDADGSPFVLCLSAPRPAGPVPARGRYRGADPTDRQPPP